ncbi:Nucleolar protein 16 [Smittium culicis]|uniref:Nucleolar protein 16 n=1 Tax=Smittium culicis TaxID=133412 RepID=A0A1R1XM64_9FUNG|nr:Nucleolar protein 16 [Smittium culicis]
MANPRQRRLKKNPNLRATRKTKNLKKKVVFKGHHLIKDEWNKKLSVRENYRKLGLVSKLNGVSGGTSTKFWTEAPSYNQENSIEADNNDESDFDDINMLLGSGSANKQKYKYSTQDIDNMKQEELESLIPKGYGLIKRSEDGKIENIVIPGDNSDDDEEAEPKPVAPKTAAAQKLEEFSKNAKKREVWCPDGHVSFAQQLINKHGLDYEAMFWDSELNVQQQTANQLKRKVQQFLKSMK